MAKELLTFKFQCPPAYTKLRRKLWGWWWKAIIAHRISSKALYIASAPLDRCAVNSGRKSEGSI